MLGTAEFIELDNVNTNLTPGSPLAINTQVFNNMPTNIVASTWGNGTAFTLTAGTYIFDYETSFTGTRTGAASIALYTGPNTSSLTIDNNTLACASTSVSWIHGRAVVDVADTLVVAICSLYNTVSVAYVLGTTCYVVRLTVIKVA
jgi:hypothetical protein